MCDGSAHSSGCVVYMALMLWLHYYYVEQLPSMFTVLMYDASSSSYYALVCHTAKKRVKLAKHPSVEKEVKGYDYVYKCLVEPAVIHSIM